MTITLYLQDTGSTPGHATLRLSQRAEELWDALRGDLPASVYASILDATNECLTADNRIGLEVAYLPLAIIVVDGMLATPDTCEVVVVPAHFCEDHAVRGLDGWAFVGYRCELCLRPTKPSRPLHVGKAVPS